MKIPHNINEKVKNIPIENRVFFYDATIVIEFLKSTFMPTEFFLNQEGVNKLVPGIKICPQFLINPDAYLDQKLSLGTMYDYYKLFREQTKYTSPVETAFKFGIIIKKLLYKKNGWQFDVRRVGRAQIIYVFPILLRIKASPEDRSLYPVGVVNVEKGIVAYQPQDLQDDSTEEIGVDMGKENGDETVKIEVVDDTFIHSGQTEPTATIPSEPVENAVEKIIVENNLEESIVRTSTPEIPESSIDPGLSKEF